MQQRIETIAEDTQNCHGSCASACASNRRAGTPPLSLPHRVRANLSEHEGARVRGRRQHLPGVFARHETVQSMQMVNAGFPAPTRYGFEMVDMAGAALQPSKPPSIENLH